MSTDPNAATQLADDAPGGRPPVLGARYELLGLLGVGGMGSVYKARDREIDELVALRVLRPEIAGPRVRSTASVASSSWRGA